VGPQLKPCAWHETGWQVTGGGGATHDARSKSMYSRIFSCGVNVFEHSFGNCTLNAVAMLATWKSL
jgi:hypothetical protein